MCIRSHNFFYNACQRLQRLRVTQRNEVNYRIILHTCIVHLQFILDTRSRTNKPCFFKYTYCT